MALNLVGYDKRVKVAVRKFWRVRDCHGVRCGKTLDAFVKLLSWVVKRNGLPHARIITGRDAKVPGYFRPSKSWDVLILNEGILVAAIELKSIADSFGKNSNNRNEEVLGSGICLKEAFAEDAFEGLTRIFVGYILLVEDCPETLANVEIQMKYFKVMEDFMANPETRDVVYIKDSSGEYPVIPGISYMDRFDILCKRLMHKNLYTSASVIKSPRSAIEDGKYCNVSAETSIRVFLTDLAGHAETISALVEEDNTI